VAGQCEGGKARSPGQPANLSTTSGMIEEQGMLVWLPISLRLYPHI